MKGRTLLGCLIAALIGFSLTLLPFLPLAFISTVEVEEMRAGENVKNVARDIPWYHLPLMVIVGLAAGFAAYFGVKSYLKRRG